MNDERSESALKQKYAAAQRLGLLDKLLRVGWGGLTAEETGRIGGLVSGAARGKKPRR